MARYQSPAAKRCGWVQPRGSSVETIFPDGRSRTAFGDNVMDLSTRPPAERAGYDQGGALAGQFTEFRR